MSTAPRVLRRYLRSGRGAMIAIGAIAAVLSILAVITPALLTNVLDRSTRHHLSQLSAPQRDLSFQIVPLFGGSAAEGAGDSLPESLSDTWGWIEGTLQVTRQDMPSAVREITTDPRYSGVYGSPAEYEATTYVSVDPWYDSRVTITEGRTPADQASDAAWSGEWTTTVDGAFPEGLPLGQASPEVSLPPVEVILSEESAAAEAWELGETRTVSAGWSIPVPLTLVGTFSADDRADDFWAHAPGILDVSRGANPDGVPYIRSTAYAHPNLAALLTRLGEPTVSGWYPVQTQAVTAASAPELLASLRAFTATSVPVTDPSGYSLPGLTLTTETTDAVARAVEQNTSTSSVAAILLAGPVGVALAVLVLACRLLWEVRRPTSALLAARGASDGQLRALRLVDGVLCGLLPGIVGMLIGFGASRAMFPGWRPSPEVVLLPLVVAVVPALVGVLTAVTKDAGARRSRGRAAASRLMAEAAVTIIAGIALFILLTRGSETTAAAVDPLVVAAPVLLSLVAAILALRALPIVLRVLLRRQQSGTGFRGLLGAARGVRAPVGALPVLALIVGLSVAVTGGVVLSVIQVGGEEAARSSVGADFVVSANLRLPEDAAEQAEEISGVETAAPLQAVDAAEFFVDHERGRIDLYLVDRSRLDAAQEGYPPLVPPDVDLGDGSGEPRILLPEAVVAARGVADSELQIIAYPVVLAGTTAATVALPPGESWAVMDVSYRDALPGAQAQLIRLYVSASDGADHARVLAELRETFGSAVTVTTATEVLDTIRADPSVAGLRLILLLGIVVTALLSAAAVVVTVILGHRSRARIIALLKSLGAPPNSAASLLRWELVPAAVTAVVFGVLLGIGLSALLLSVIDMRAFAGGAIEPRFVLDPFILVASVGGFVLITVLIAIVAVFAGRRVRAATVLRTVEES